MDVHPMTENPIDVKPLDVHPTDFQTTDFQTTSFQTMGFLKIPSKEFIQDINQCHTVITIVLLKLARNAHFDYHESRA